MNRKIKIALTVCTILLSTTVATARTKPDRPMQLLSQQPNEVQTLQQDEKIRDRVELEVDRAFNRTTSLLNTLIFVLILFPIFMVAGVWLLRRSVINQVASETKNILKPITDKLEQQLQADISVNFQGQTQDIKQEIEIIKTESISQITNIISEAQTVLAALTEQVDIVNQELQRLRYQQEQFSSIRNMPSEISQNNHLPLVQNEQVESLQPQQVWTANDYLNRGNALFSEGCYQEANNSYNEAVKLEPNFGEARYQNARSYALQYRVNLAIGNLQWAIDINPEYKEMAKTDTAFDAIRSDSQFKKLMSEE